MGGGGSQRLLCLNPTTVMVVLFLGLWLLLGCDNLSNTTRFIFLDSICQEVIAREIQNSNLSSMTKLISVD